MKYEIYFRSWDKVCVVLRGTQIRFYKDNKAYKTSPDATYRGEVPIDVVGATAEIASDYKKKPHVFRLKYDIMMNSNFLNFLEFNQRYF